MSFDLVNSLRSELRQSVRVLSGLNLYQGAKWSAEALNSLVDDSKSTSQIESKASFNPPDVSTKDMDKILLANTYFSVKEFDRCANVLKDCTSSTARFIRLYASFLNGEKKKEEESEGVLGSNDNPHLVNSFLPIMLKDLEGWISLNDPFFYYLYGVVLLKQKSHSEAQDALIQSIKIYPFNWCAWEELISSLQSFDLAQKVVNNLTEYFGKNFGPVEHVMLSFFKIVVNQEFFQQSVQLYQDLESLLKIFPSHSFLKIQKALISYHALEYQDAEALFDDILVNDPLRLDDMDTYSNILYVMEKKSKLAYLAQLASSIDKFRPETCCIIANYYSLKFEHEKAIMYYRRALTLNRNCLSAWTLMGHEFVELKNSHAAIESYRRAVDTNNKDFKAWYGLGQAYEVLDMHLYSLYYYQQACALKPLDKRIWIALGNCYEKLDKLKDAIKSYHKASQLSEIPDVTIYYKLALLYKRLSEPTKVYEFMELCYQEEINEGIKNDETCKARLWLAKFEMERKNWKLAHEYVSDMNYGTSQEIEEARFLAREARNKLSIK